MPAGYCTKCGVHRKRLHQHHIVSRNDGGTDDPENLLPLCANCHEDEHEGSPYGQATYAAKQRKEREETYPRELLYDLYVVQRLSGAQIGRLLGIAKSTAHYLIKDYGIEFRQVGRPRLEIEDVDWVALYEKHTSVEIAEMLGVSPLTAQRLLRRAGVELRPPGVGPGDEPLDREVIIEALAAEGTVAGAARRLGMPATTLHYHVRRLGIEVPKKRPSRKDVAAAYKAADYVVAVMAEALGVSYSTGDRWLKEYKLKRPGKPGRRKGAKWSDAERAARTKSDD